MEPQYKLFLHPIDLSRLTSIKHKVFKKIKGLNVTCKKSHEPTTYEDRMNGQKKIHRGTIWGDIYDSAWFHFTGDIDPKYKNENLIVLLDVSGEGLIVGDNKIAKQGTSHIFSIATMAEFLNPPTGKTFYRLEKGLDKVDIWMDAGYNGYGGYRVWRGILTHAALATMNEEIYDYYFDYVSLCYLRYVYKDEDKVELTKALTKSFHKFETGKLNEAKEILNKFLNNPSENELEVTAVGHSHLDLAWLWPIRETKRKAARTLSTAIKNMKLYPQYVYGASQPQEFERIKETYPNLIDELKILSDKGQFEVQGGMWVECDTNITGGESLIRQFVYGMRYWEENFNKTVNNCWLPDVFGYSAALPQILKKCGIDYFMTQKLSWNNVNDFKLQTFNWEGLSKDQVLVHLLPGNRYDSTGTATVMHELEARHKRKDKVTHEALLCFGAGDGGGGPSEADIELIKRIQNVKGLPKLKFDRAENLFKKLGTYKEKLPVYKGELYLEKHQGTYTTQSDIKRHNRECEHLLHTVESLGAKAILKGYKYPKEKIEKIWKEVLLYQFHDILPGSAINRVYKEANVRYEILIRDLKGFIQEELDYLKENDEGLSVYNPSPFRQSGYILRNQKLYKYYVNAYEANNLIEVSNSNFDLSCDENHLENEYLKLTFDNRGFIKNCIDKRTNKEFSLDGLNVLNVYKDKRLFFNAWDIDINYTKKKPSVFKLVSTKFYKEGASVVLKHTYKYHKSKLIQKTILTSNDDVIKFDTDVDWHETHKMLRADFRPTEFNEEVECDIQFGNIKRSTKTDNKINWAQFEICAHKYVDVSNEKFGNSVITNSKYGYRVKDGLISLNLLRSPVYPDKTADRGHHHFTYAYYPHVNNSEKAEVIKKSYNFNFDPIIYEGNLNIKSLIHVKTPTVVVETLKPAENGKGIVVRLFETLGKKTNVTIEVDGDFKVYESNMREMKEKEISNNLVFEPFEIKTLILK